jgi:hypothetical protein
MKTGTNILINLALFFSGFFMSLSGLILQITYHLGRRKFQNPSFQYWGANYWNWSNMHKISVCLFLAALACHFYKNWKWYKAVLMKRLFAKNRQTLALSIVFVLVSISGIIPWIVSGINPESISRNALVEIHDKIALIFFVYMCIHVIRRRKRLIM